MSERLVTRLEGERDAAKRLAEDATAKSVELAAENELLRACAAGLCGMLEHPLIADALREHPGTPTPSSFWAKAVEARAALKAYTDSGRQPPEPPMTSGRAQQLLDRKGGAS